MESGITWLDGYQACQFKLHLKAMSVTYELCMKRFQEKLLIVVTDGQKFGNVLSASYTKSDEAGIDMMMDMRDEFTGQQSTDDLEFTSMLLLGDRKQQQMLELLTQALLQTLITFPQFQEVKTILLTIQTNDEVRKLDTQQQMNVFMREFIQEFKMKLVANENK